MATSRCVGCPAERLARLVAYVPQKPELPPDMTVSDYVLLGRTPHIGYFGFESAEDRAVCADAPRAPRPRAHGRAPAGHAVGR